MTKREATLRARIGELEAMCVELRLDVKHLLDTVSKMDTLHTQCLDRGCTCYSDPEDVCVHCNKSTRLSTLAKATLAKFGRDE